MNEAFVAATRQHLSQLGTEIAERNEYIEQRDDYIYGDRIKNALDIPIGHDHTPVNMLKRAVEIHRDQFMGRGFTLVSTYDSADPSTASEPEDRERIKVENQTRKARAEARRRLVDAIVRDNGGYATFKDLAENAGAVGFSVAKGWYDEEEKKYRIVPVESVENFYALWSEENFRDADLFAYVYQISPQQAIDRYGLERDEIQTSRLGEPDKTVSPYGSIAAFESSQDMATVMELTGKIPGWKSQNGKMVKCPRGKENNVNVLVVGKKIVRLIDDEKKLPRYYVFPNRKERRRPWGRSDVSDSMIQLNLSYIETFSDWRTVANKVNFPKFKMYGFSTSSQLPKFDERKVQGIPLADGQDLARQDMGDASTIDWNNQLAEIKEQFVKEAAISRVLFDDPSINLNSNQALMTSMKPTTDVAEAKKTLWAPVLSQMFSDALNVIAEYEKDVKELLDDDEDWHFEVKWPTTMQREDPLFQQMLLNRFNSNTISLQTFLEEQGETKEEIDRIRDEMEDPLTAAVLSRQLPILTQQLLTPAGPPQPDVKVNLRGDLTPYQEANLATQQGFNDGPFPPTAGPQGNQGRIAQENADNQGFIEGNPFNGGTPIQRGQDGQPIQGSQNQPQVTTTQANNQEGQGAVSQPGSGATPVSPQGAINQQNQQEGA